MSDVPSKNIFEEFVNSISDDGSGEQPDPDSTQVDGSGEQLDPDSIQEKINSLRLFEPDDKTFESKEKADERPLYLDGDYAAEGTPLAEAREERFWHVFCKALWNEIEFEDTEMDLSPIGELSSDKDHSYSYLTPAEQVFVERASGWLRDDLSRLNIDNLDDARDFLSDEELRSNQAYVLFRTMWHPENSIKNLDDLEASETFVEYKPVIASLRNILNRYQVLETDALPVRSHLADQLESAPTENDLVELPRKSGVYESQEGDSPDAEPLDQETYSRTREAMRYIGYIGNMTRRLLAEIPSKKNVATILRRAHQGFRDIPGSFPGDYYPFVDDSLQALLLSEESHLRSLVEQAFHKPTEHLNPEVLKLATSNFAAMLGQIQTVAEFLNERKEEPRILSPEEQLIAKYMLGFEPIGIGTDAPLDDPDTGHFPTYEDIAGLSFLQGHYLPMLKALHEAVSTADPIHGVDFPPDIIRKYGLSVSPLLLDLYQSHHKGLIRLAKTYPIVQELTTFYSNIIFDLVKTSKPDELLARMERKGQIGHSLSQKRYDKWARLQKGTFDGDTESD